MIDGAGTLGRRLPAVSEPIRVMVEAGKKKRTVAVALDWPGWDRSAKTGDEALRVLAAYRPRYARVAAQAGLGDAFAATGGCDIVERLAGTGMTDFYGLSGRWTEAESGPLSEAECERRLAILQAAWAIFDATAARVTPELRKGPRGGGRDRDQIVRHANGAEIFEYAPKVGVRVPLETREDPGALRVYRAAFVAAIRAVNGRGLTARTWPMAFLFRRATWHMLDHAWEMEDRDLSGS